MNKKIIIICLLTSLDNFVFAEEHIGDASVIDLNKVNGKQDTEKSCFAGIDETMKVMENNILKLMRELGELKMQMQELKDKAKKEDAEVADCLQAQKNEDITITVTTSD